MDCGLLRYRLFGLLIESELPLPELAGQHQDGDKREADITIRLGSAGGENGSAFKLDIDGVARFVIAGGRSITVDPAPGAGEADIRLFLLGSAMGAALHQRGILPLHANAVVMDSKAVAFTGRSGAGKSTLAAWFHDQDYQILADDVCVIRIGPEGRPRIKLVWHRGCLAKSPKEGKPSRGNRDRLASFSRFNEVDRRKYDQIRMAFALALLDILGGSVGRPAGDR